jgi:Arc/MetJ family transcription regulator
MDMPATASDVQRVGVADAMRGARQLMRASGLDDEKAAAVARRLALPIRRAMMSPLPPEAIGTDLTDLLKQPVYAAKPRACRNRFLT